MREEAGRLDDLLGRDTGDQLGLAWREGLQELDVPVEADVDRFAVLDRLELGVLVDELLVVPVFLDDHVRHGMEHGEVVSRNRVEVHVGQ